MFRKGDTWDTLTLPSTGVARRTESGRPLSYPNGRHTPCPLDRGFKYGRSRGRGPFGFGGVVVKDGVKNDLYTCVDVRFEARVV